MCLGSAQETAIVSQRDVVRRASLLPQDTVDMSLSIYDQDREKM